jgi:hypothetical protein
MTSQDVEKGVVHTHPDPGAPRRARPELCISYVQLSLDSRVMIEWSATYHKRITMGTPWPLALCGRALGKSASWRARGGRVLLGKTRLGALGGGWVLLGKSASWRARGRVGVTGKERVLARSGLGRC